MRGFTLSIAVALTTLTSAANANPWSELAIEDLHGIHDIIRDNHPGPVDPENPHFRDWMEGGLVKAMAKARVARNYSDYFRALQFYANGFEDGHLNIFPIVAPQSADWPGFVIGTGAEGSPEVISAESDSGVKVGDRIESCDGQPIDALMRTRTDPYFWNRAIPQARLMWVSQMFVANPDEQDSRLKSCRFSSGEVKLNWRSSPVDALQKKIDPRLADTPFALTQVAGVWFVRVPRFYFKLANDQKSYEALIDDLKAKASELRKATVVFDVRGNPGGNSDLGYEVASALWGESWPKRIRSSLDWTVDWRVSHANIQMVAKEGQTALVQAMNEAQAQRKTLVAFNNPPAKPTDTPPPDPVIGRVFLLTDSVCASACLDFADLMLHIPGVVQVGGATYADAVYIDGNVLPLPSGLTKIAYGMKVYRHRIRGNNQWYEPKYRRPGGQMTDEAIAKWVKTLPPDDGSGPIIAGGPMPHPLNAPFR